MKLATMGATFKVKHLLLEEQIVESAYSTAKKGKTENVRVAPAPPPTAPS